MNLQWLRLLLAISLYSVRRPRSRLQSSTRVSQQPSKTTASCGITTVYLQYPHRYHHHHRHHLLLSLLNPPSLWYPPSLWNPLNLWNLPNLLSNDTPAAPALLLPTLLPLPLTKYLNHPWKPQQKRQLSLRLHTNPRHRHILLSHAPSVASTRSACLADKAETTLAYISSSPAAR